MPQGRINPYIYDPSQQIRKDLGGASMTIEQGFQNVIDRKKQEYDYVNKAFEEIENTKKDLNVHNYELMTKRSNELVSELKDVIKEKGKVDFSKLGEVKFKVREIVDAKRNSEISIQAYGEVTKMIQANAAYMIDPIGTHAKIMARLKDPKNLFSPKDMQDVAMQDFKDGIDYVKIGQEKLQELIKKGTPIQGIFNASDGSLMEYKGIVPFGFKLDDATKTIVPNVTVDKEGKESNPVEMIANSLFDQDQLQGFTKQVAGHGMLLNSNPADYVKDLIKTTLGSSISYGMKKTADQVRIEGLKADKAAQDLIKANRENSPEYIQLEKDKKEADIRYREKSISNIGASTNIAAGNLAQRQREFAYRQEQDALSPDNKKETTAIQFSSPNAFYSNEKYGDEQIKAVSNNTRGGIMLLKKDGGKPIVLDTESKFTEFYNNSSVETRKALNKLKASSGYVPLKGGNTLKPSVGKSTATQKTKFDPNNPL